MSFFCMSETRKEQINQLVRDVYTRFLYNDVELKLSNVTNIYTLKKEIKRASQEYADNIINDNYNFIDSEIDRIVNK